MVAALALAAGAQPLRPQYSTSAAQLPSSRPSAAYPHKLPETAPGLASGLQVEILKPSVRQSSGIFIARIYLMINVVLHHLLLLEAVASQPDHDTGLQNGIPGATLQGQRLKENIC